ncbi:MAG: hypothetical protein ACI9MC_002638 [Kiritimatiellia bacterium]|jgi:hypothetical protein
MNTAPVGTQERPLRVPSWGRHPPGSPRYRRCYQRRVFEVGAETSRQQRLLPRPPGRRRRAKLRRSETPVHASRWTCSTDLPEHLSGVDSLACPQCGDQMTLRTVVGDASAPHLKARIELQMNWIGIVSCSRSFTMNSS